MYFSGLLVIATPEKARALLRAAPELFDAVKLFVIDEGHLIGQSIRDVRNEIFVDHLRMEAQRIGARILLLSAVLPNTEELAQWIAADRNSVARSSWKPSAERYGFLRWTGTQAQLEWLGEVPSFNPSFVVAKRKSSRSNSASFPSRLNEAVAACAVRLSEVGPVMIFTARAVTVAGFARAALQYLGSAATPHPWPKHVWRVFEEACKEELADDAIELKAARRGIICHSNRLTPLVRMATEQLMRSFSPKIIVATSTLAQGVNVGISSVIVASTAINYKRHVHKRDFWNICGRAGRAFVDVEGKILYALDASPTHSWAVEDEKKRAETYFDQNTPKRVESGLLIVLNHLWRIAREAGVSFTVLVERIANDDRTAWADSEAEMEEVLDVLDDTLLAMHMTSMHDESAVPDDLAWIERMFKESLATIQARAGVDSISDQGVLQLLHARASAVLRRIPKKIDRQAVVSSGLPLSVAIRLRSDMNVFRTLVQKFMEDGWSTQALSDFVEQVEIWSRAYATAIVDEMPDEAPLAQVRPSWLAGESLKSIANGNADTLEICRDFYGFKLPWILNAIAQQFDPVFEDDERTLVGNIALAVELGVPTIKAARIFLAGVRSRVVSTELAGLPVMLSESIPKLARQLRDEELWADLFLVTSPAADRWLALLANETRPARAAPSEFRPFTFRRTIVASPLLYVRSHGSSQYLCSPDGLEKLRVHDTAERPFSSVADNPAFAFVREGERWRLDVRDPRVQPRQ